MNAATADLILVNGNIITVDVLTMDRPCPATAVAFQNGRITRVGDSRTLLQDARPATKVVDLGGRTAIPAFTDAHAHVWKMGHLLTTMLDLRRTGSLDALVNIASALGRRVTVNLDAA